MPCFEIALMCSSHVTGGFSVFAGVGERTREGNDLYKEMIESVRPSPPSPPTTPGGGCACFQPGQLHHMCIAMTLTQ